jgi:hypothetical protein
MTMKRPTYAKIAATAMALGLLAGCATTGQLEQLQADVARAQETADAAQAAAAEANRKAEAAMSAANAAQDAADDCSERCDRMMQKAMMK